MEEKQLCLAQNGPSSKGLVVKNSQRGVEKKPRLWVSQKEAEERLLSLF